MNQRRRLTIFGQPKSKNYIIITTMLTKQDIAEAIKTERMDAKPKINVSTIIAGAPAITNNVIL